MSTFANDSSCPESLALITRDQFLTAASHAGGYGLPISLVVAALVSKNPTVKTTIAALTIALSAGQMAYFLRLLPWPKEVAPRPLAGNVNSIDPFLTANAPALLNKLMGKQFPHNPTKQRILDVTIRFLENEDLNGFPSADLAALTAGLAFLGLQQQSPSPSFVLFSYATVLACAYSRVKFMPFHTWPQVLAGIVTGAGYSFLAQKFGVIPSGIAINLGTLVLYSAFTPKPPKPVFMNAGYFLLSALVYRGSTHLSQ